MVAIRQSVAAENDLIEIWHYGYHHWGIDQADRYLDDIERTMALLAKHPKLSRLREDLALPVRIHPHNRHIIVYQEFPDHIFIVRVLHQTVDVPSHLIGGSDLIQ